MIDKEVAELRRRFRPDRTAITHYYGCYVDCTHEIVSEFDLGQDLGENSEEQYLKLLKKAVSGKIGKTVFNVSFATKDVAVHTNDEYEMLTRLLKDGFKCDEAAAETRHAFYEAIIAAHNSEDGYIILLARDAYDVPLKRGKRNDSDDESGDAVHRYFVCAICPVKGKSTDMKYDQGKKYFHIDDVDLYVKAPQFGMMFPAFDDRQTNLYGALYYAKKKDDVGEGLYHCFFGADAPLCLDEQAARFGAVLKGAYNKLELETVQAVSASIREKLDAQKESDDNGPLILSADTVGDILREYGASDSEVAKAEGAFEEQYGSAGTVVASNVVPTKKVRYETPFMKLAIDAEKDGVVSLREMGGRQCLIIDLDGYPLSVNGIDVS